MAHLNLPARTLPEVMRRVAANVTMREEAADMLSRFLRYRRPQITERQVARLEDTIRAHRVSVIKQRAIIGALGFADGSPT